MERFKNSMKAMSKNLVTSLVFLLSVYGVFLPTTGYGVEQEIKGSFIVEDQITDLVWNEMVATKACNSKDVSACILLKGSYAKPGWQLLYENAAVTIAPTGEFELQIPFHEHLAKVNLSAKGPDGKVEVQSIGFIADENQPTPEPGRAISEAEPQATPAAPAAAEPRHYDFSGGVFPVFSLLEISAHDNTNNADGHFASNLNLGVDLRGSVRWGNPYEAYANVKMQSLSLQSVSSKTLDDNSQALLSAHLGFGRYFLESEDLFIGLQLGFAQQIFLRGISQTELTLDKVLLPEVRLHGLYTIYEAEKFSLSADGGISYYVPVSTSNESVHSSFAMGLKVMPTWEFTKFRLGSGAFVNQSFLNSNIVNQHETEVGIEIGIQW